MTSSNYTEKQLREQQLLPSPPLPDSGPPKEASNVQTPNEPRSIYPKLPLYDSEELPYTDKSDILVCQFIFSFFYKYAHIK